MHKRTKFHFGSSLIVEFYTHYKHIGHVIIPKPHFSSREGITSHCRRFDLLIFAVLAQSVTAISMTAVVAAPTGRWRFNHDHIITGATGPFNSHMLEGRSSR